MSPAESVAEVFVMALKSMPKNERDAVLVRIAHDKDFYEDLIDLIEIEKRRNEPSRPFREYLAEKGYQE